MSLLPINRWNPTKRQQLHPSVSQYIARKPTTGHTRWHLRSYPLAIENLENYSGYNDGPWGWKRLSVRWKKATTSRVLEDSIIFKIIPHHLRIKPRHRHWPTHFCRNLTSHSQACGSRILHFTWSQSAIIDKEASKPEIAHVRESWLQYRSEAVSMTQVRARNLADNASSCSVCLHWHVWQRLRETSSMESVCMRIWPGVGVMRMSSTAQRNHWPIGLHSPYIQWSVCNIWASSRPNCTSNSFPIRGFRFYNLDENFLFSNSGHKFGFCLCCLYMSKFDVMGHS